MLVILCLKMQDYLSFERASSSPFGITIEKHGVATKHKIAAEQIYNKKRWTNEWNNKQTVKYTGLHKKFTDKWLFKHIRLQVVLMNGILESVGQVFGGASDEKGLELGSLRTMSGNIPVIE